MGAKRVALLIETSSSWGSLIISGISDFVHQHDRWVLYMDHSGFREQRLPPADWNVDGILARVVSVPLAESILNLGVPCVNVSQYRVPVDGIQHVTANECRVGELGAKSLFSAGLRHFAYYGPPPREYYTDNILVAFRKQIEEAGFTLEVIDRAAVHSPLPEYNLDIPALAAVLQRLPQPVGILTWNALGAHHINEACCWAGLKVPAQVSILAGEYDILTVEVSSPRLTCLDQAPRQIGFLAATELQRLMEGGTVEPPKLVEPAGIVPGETMITSAVRDELVAQAMAFITANAARNITLQDVLEAVPTSRRNLQRRFQQALGHGPAEEIRRWRLAEARRLLAETDLQIKAISMQCGFANPEQLQRLLRAETSMTPSQYRAANRRPHAENGQMLKL